MFSFRSRISLLSRLGVLLLACSNAGCSFVFVTPAPARVSLPTAHPHADCTSSRLAPVLDGILTGYELVRVGYAAQASNGDYGGLPIDRGTDLALGAGFAGLFLTSTIYGIVNTSACYRLKHGPAFGEEMPGITRELPVDSPDPLPPAAPAKSSLDQYWDAGTRPDVPPVPTAAPPAALPSAAPAQPEPTPAAPSPSAPPAAAAFPEP